jgi:3-phenylpropionate/trans-cinnamate dioxygenase ferredoxin subunit
MSEGWQAAAALDAVPEGLSEALLGNALVLLVRRGEDIRAVQGLCPHAFARLVEGHVDAREILHCPRHKATFRLADGSCGPGWVLPPLKRYPVRIADGTVWLPDPLTPLP